VNGFSLNVRGCQELRWKWRIMQTRCKNVARGQKEGQNAGEQVQRMKRKKKDLWWSSQFLTISTIIWIGLRSLH